MANKKPFILISNDDGVHAKGLAELTKAALQFARVMVVAPEKGESGMSHAITMTTPLRVKKIKEAEDLVIYTVNGTPADCIKLSLNRLVDRKPDLILSGVNHGTNSSISVIYSGTLGAAREGCLNGIPSVGLSFLSHDHKTDFSCVNHFLPRIIKAALDNAIAEQTLLNVNFPNIPIEEVKGIKICKQTKGAWKEIYDQRQDPHGGTYYWLTGTFENLEEESEETDEWALANGYISMVPVQIDSTSYPELERLKKWKFYQNI